MKRTARRRLFRRRFSMLFLFTVILLVSAGRIAADGKGTPDQDLTGQENPSAQAPDATGIEPTFSTQPSNQEPDTSIQLKCAPVPLESAPLPTSTSIPTSTEPVTVDSTPQSTSTPIPTSDEPVSTEDNWALMLVNWEHALPDDFSAPELTQLRNGHAVDSRIYPELQNMMDDARAAGLQPLICSSYRTWETQERLFKQKVQGLLDQGYAQDEAMDKAAMWVARPGTSEHQTGLAVDIVDMSYQILDERQESTPVQKWLIAHCAEYGFILRYPTEKSALTGVNYEPWHYRYVGAEVAKEIMGNGLCLEEYLLR